MVFIFVLLNSFEILRKNLERKNILLEVIFERIFYFKCLEKMFLKYIVNGYFRFITRSDGFVYCR